MAVQVAQRTSRRLPVAAFAVVAVGLFSAVVLLDRAARQDARQRAAAELNAVGALKVAIIGAWSGERLRDAGLVAGYPSVIRAAAEARDGTLAPDLNAHLQELLGNLAGQYGYLRVTLLDLAGRPLADWARPGGRVEPLTPGLARSAAASPGGTATELVSEEGRDRPVLQVAAVVRVRGSPAAVVAIRASMERVFDDAIQSWPIPSTSANS